MREKLKMQIWNAMREKELEQGLQRYWERCWVVEHLPPNPSSVILDAGCDPDLLFPKVLASHYKTIVANDPLPCTANNVPASIQYVQAATQDCLREWRGTPIHAITCVSVLEHVGQEHLFAGEPEKALEEKQAFCEALDAVPCPILMTLEYSKDEGLSHLHDKLITHDILTFCLSHFQHHYLAEMAHCPVWASNSRSGEWQPLALRLLPL